MTDIGEIPLALSFERIIWVRRIGFSNAVVTRANREPYNVVSNRVMKGQ
jgi:hypothetical protein